MIKQASQYIIIFLVSTAFFVACMSSGVSRYGERGGKPLSEKEQLAKENFIEQAKKESLLGDLEAARINYLDALKIDPDCDVCYYELAMVYYRANYLVNAVNLSRAAYKRDSVNRWYRIQLAQLTAMAGDYKTAEGLYASLLKENPEDPNSYYTLASVYENMRKFDQALALYDTVQTRFGFNEDVVARKQEIYARLGEYTNSIAEAKKLVQYDPEDPRYYALLGDSYAQALRDSLALSAYDTALKLNADFSPALVGIAEVARRTGDFDKYFTYIKRYFDSDSDDDRSKASYLSMALTLPSFTDYFKNDIDILFTILNTKYAGSDAVAYLFTDYLTRTARVDSAVNLLSGYIKSDSANYAPWGQMLAIEYDLMRWDSLKTDAGKAIKLFPQRFQSYMYRGVALWQLKELDGAAADFEQVIKLAKAGDPIILQMYAFLGDLYHQMGKEQKAFHCYDLVLKVDSTNAMVLNNYAYFLCLKGNKKDLERCYKMSKAAIGLDPENASFLDTFGWILYLQGKYSEAKVIFRQALAAEGGKESATCLEHYGDVLYKLGEYDTAAVYWGQAMGKPDCENKKEIQQKIDKLNKQ